MQHLVTIRSSVMAGIEVYVNPGCQDTPQPPTPLRRIYIIGPSCSGKTTLGTRLAERFNLPHIEIDSINWQPGWQPLPDMKLRERIRSILASTLEWVVDGNYSAVRDMLWQAADTIIWLDFPLWFVMGRLFRRTVGRIVKRTKLWDSNYETFKGAFLSRDSLFLWILTSHRRRKIKYTVLFTERLNPQAVYYHFRSQREVDEWMRSLAA
jgi:adenylate kinase family enzyme